MSRAVVTSLYCHNHLISLVMLDCQRQPLMCIDVKRREIWEWSDHTRAPGSRSDRKRLLSPLAASGPGIAGACCGTASRRGAGRVPKRLSSTPPDTVKATGQRSRDLTA